MVRLTYKPNDDALYIKIAGDQPIARTVQIDPGTLVDVDRDGNALGIEVLQPGRAWPLADIIEAFVLDEDDAEMLRAMWPGGKAFPFSRSAAFA